jgi:hypothetical protein
MELFFLLLRLLCLMSLPSTDRMHKRLVFERERRTVETDRIRHYLLIQQ